jgi:dihydrofolate reductase
MRRLGVFNHVSLDGYFVDAAGDMSWAHQNDDPEWAEFTIENASGGGALLFGRVTYEMMAGYWRTAQASEAHPEVAEGMNQMPKVVCSRTLREAAWPNTRIIKGDIAAQLRAIKDEPGPDLVILGSGTVVAQLAQAGVIDHYQVVVNPIVLGAGRTMFAGVEKPMHQADAPRARAGTALPERQRRALVRDRTSLAQRASAARAIARTTSAAFSIWT